MLKHIIWHLGYFKILTLISNTAVNTFIHVYKPEFTNWQTNLTYWCVLFGHSAVKNNKLSTFLKIKTFIKSKLLDSSEESGFDNSGSPIPTRHTGSCWKQHVLQAGLFSSSLPSPLALFIVTCQAPEYYDPTPFPFNYFLGLSSQKWSY